MVDRQESPGKAIVQNTLDLTTSGEGAAGIRARSVGGDGGAAWGKRTKAGSLSGYTLFIAIPNNAKVLEQRGVA